MKKFYFLLIALFGFSFAHAQYTINFDTFTTGDVSTQSPYLILWPAATATDPQVSTTFAHSAPNSMWVRPNASGIADDILFQLGNKNSGTWIVKFWVYVPTGNNGYFNIQEHETASPAQWNGEFFIDLTTTGGSAGMVTHDQTSSMVAYPNDTWFQIVITVNLDTDEISVDVDGNSLLQNAVYEDTSGLPANQLGAVDFYSSDAGTSFYIDDFELFGCNIPGNLVLTAVTDTTADISWDPTNETNGYAWVLMANGDDPLVDTPLQTGTTVTGVANVSLTGLTAFTEYDFYVLSDCGTLQSNYGAVLNFKTTLSCNVTGAVTSFPFMETFELTSLSIGCWTQIQETGTAEWTYAAGSSGGMIAAAYAGSQNAKFVSENSSNSPITKLVSPKMDLTALANPGVSFFYAQEGWFGDQNELKVYYRTSETTAWVQLAHYTSDVNAWTQATVLLPNPSATYQIAFEGINNFGYANVVDAVVVGEQTISCANPTNIVVTPGSTTVDFSWDASPDETNGYDWAVMEIGDNPDVDTPVAYGTTATGATNAQATGLASETNYDLYIRTACDNGLFSTGVGPIGFLTEELFVTSPDFEHFSFYPNPVQNQLSLTSKNPISEITVYNLLGEKVISKKPGQVNFTLETAQLQRGAYFMEVVIEGSGKIFKLLKR